MTCPILMGSELEQVIIGRVLIFYFNILTSPANQPVD